MYKYSSVNVTSFIKEGLKDIRDFLQNVEGTFENPDNLISKFSGH